MDRNDAGGLRCCYVKHYHLLVIYLAGLSVSFNCTSCRMIICNNYCYVLYCTYFQFAVQIYNFTV